MDTRPEPPDPKEWSELGIYEKCTCNEYSWSEGECPYAEQVDEIIYLCNCCPFHEMECVEDI